MEQLFHVGSLHDIRRATKAAILPPSLIGVGRVQATELQQYVMRFTPQDAIRILENVHPKQRKVSKSQVNKLLRSMQAGDWHEPPFTFDTIAFDGEGRLVNGLHRMTALSMHDKPLSFIVLVGVDSPYGMPLPEGDVVNKRRDSFVAGIDQGDWSVANFLAEVLLGAQVAGRSDVVELMTILDEAIGMFPRLTLNPPAAPVRAAFVYRWASQSDPIYRQQLVEQWGAYCRVDVTQLWRSMGHLYRMMRVAKDRGERRLQFARTVYAIDHPDLTRMMVNADKEVSDARKWIGARVELLRSNVQ